MSPKLSTILSAASAIIMAVGVLPACSNSTPEGGSGCVSNGECDAGEVCDGGACIEVCSTDVECDTGLICESSICITGARDIPEITSIDSNGPEQALSGQADHQMLNQLVIHGANLQGASITLKRSSDTAATDLEICTSTDTEVRVNLPQNLVAGDYALSATNQSGSCDSVLPILQGIAGIQGETGATGPMPVVASSGGLIGDGSTGSPIALDTSFVALNSHSHASADITDFGNDVRAAMGATPLAGADGGPLKVAYMSDDFSDGNFNASPFWDAYDGGYSIIGESLVGTTDAHIQVMSQQAFGEWEWTWNKIGNFEFWLTNTLKNQMVMNTGMGYVLYFSDPSGGATNNNTLTLKSSNGGTAAIFASADVSGFTEGTVMNMKVVRYHDGRFLVYIDGNEVIDAVDTTHQNSNFMGLYNWNAGTGYIDNVRLTRYVSH